MSHASLTTRYRPQTFADLAGQETLKAILSRAAAEDKVAPAYLFSGTRGVGKTTIARIFAKALNCRNPVQGSSGREPCNQCELCRSITLGSSVDVVEIDGASNRGIDDVRRLKESVGYAPMESRYKIFIIDEAHMLSREAFNALLKTLEEPPARVTFIMATTEPHKFPVTIVSRCQHYVFKRLSDAELETHLKKVLAFEKQSYEDAALRLLTRRAAGSVRDGMSMLGQVLALGGQTLTEADTRAVLGLAGQELFFRLIAAIKDSDCAALSLLTREMLDQGIDLGFFLRELTSTWRNLFMLRQIGREAMPLLELPLAEAQRWAQEAEDMELAHIHACWQLTLEGQRRVLTSLEPSMALELLLFNLAMLPRLISMEQLSGAQRKLSNAKPDRAEQPELAEKKTSLSAETEATSHNSHSFQTDKSASFGEDQAEPEPQAELTEQPESAPLAGHPMRVAHTEQPTQEDQSTNPAKPGQPGDWAAFLAFCATKVVDTPDAAAGAEVSQTSKLPASLPSLLASLSAEWNAEGLSLTPPDKFSAERLRQPVQRDALNVLLRDFCGYDPALRLLPPPEIQQNRDNIRDKVENLPTVKALEASLGAKLIDCGPWYR
ncbi:MAG: DNA polymerase III subunit gamma/tau [Deltaproteobacteria bacterium]|jgi:DNA polymerase-3 subunit gamma/tau|nr:DNA polymerase III subunit gamma/tau [Deltaproteobacteria bacterium]